MAQTEASAPAAEEGGAPYDQPVFSGEQIEQMVAPIALYPDALLAQVLMSATYPLEIVQASRWLKQNPDLKDEALDVALREEAWDPSVKTLAMFPTVLQRMNDNLDWTQDLGDAFLAQEADVMNAVQRLRTEAQQTGALKDTPQQKVVVENDAIVVEPADPQVVYVPTYDPSQVYGTPAPTTQYYPAVYQQPAYATTATDSFLTFGAGALVGGLLTAAIMWDDDDDDWYDGWGYRRHVWHHGPGYWDDDWRGPRYGSDGWRNWRGDVNIDGDVCVGRCINIDRNEWKKQARTFEHRPEHRGGVRYKDVTNVAARYPDIGNKRPGRPTQRPGGGGERPGRLPRPPERPDLGQRPDRPGIGGGGERPGISTRPAQRPDRPGVGGGDRERPAIATRPAERPQLGGKDRDRPGVSTRPAERPQIASKDRDRPGVSTRPAERPQLGGKDRDRPGVSTRPAERPQLGGKDRDRPGVATRPAARPKAESRPAQRPATREARPAKQPKAPTKSVSRAPQAGKGNAFQSRAASNVERTASKRGAASRGKASPKARPKQQAKAPTRSVKQAPKASKGNAFQSRGSGKNDRAASKRGASSRGKAGRPGGGGGRAGGKKGRN